MTTISLQEAQTQLADLIHQMGPDAELVITENDRPVARLITATTPQGKPSRPRPPVTGVPKAGSCQGLFVVPPDFKEPLEELREYME